MLRRHLRHSPLLAKASILAAMLMLVVAGAATAGDAAPDDPSPAWTPAPTCVTHEIRRTVVGQYVDVTNNCANPQRVKVIIAFGRDSSCRLLYPFGSFTHDFVHAASFDGIARC